MTVIATEMYQMSVEFVTEDGISTCGCCTDASACNYDPSAGIDDGSCAQDDMCVECGGDGSSCSGCMNPDADNYDASAMYDDGSCAWGDGLCTGLSYEVVSSDPIGTGASYLPSIC